MKLSLDVIGDQKLDGLGIRDSQGGAIERIPYLFVTRSRAKGKGKVYHVSEIVIYTTFFFPRRFRWQDTYTLIAFKSKAGGSPKIGRATTIALYSTLNIVE